MLVNIVGRIQDLISNLEGTLKVDKVKKVGVDNVNKENLTILGNIIKIRFIKKGLGRPYIILLKEKEGVKING